MKRGMLLEEMLGKWSGGEGGGEGSVEGIGSNMVVEGEGEVVVRRVGDLGELLRVGVDKGGGSELEMGLKTEWLVSEGVSGVGVERDERVREGGGIFG